MSEEGNIGPLDIWPALSFSTSLGNQPNTLTPERWNAGIWSVLDGHGVTRVVEGLTVQGREITSYTAGNQHGKKVLIMSGVHPNESIGLHGGFRFFEQFAKSSHPAMADLRDRCRITYVSCLNLDRFRQTRKNANNVDINRNHDFHWKRFDDGGSTSGYSKGDDIASEPETQVAQAILDQGWDCMIDCHDTPGTENQGPGDSTVQYATPSTWVMANRAIGAMAAQLWRQYYVEDPEVDVIADYFANADPFPNFTNHTAYQLGVAQERVGFGAFLVEACRAALGSVQNQSTPQPMLKRYCGLMYCCLVTWLAHGRVPVDPPRPDLLARRNTPDYATSITAGGTKLDTAAGISAYLTWDGFGPTSPSKPMVTPLGTVLQLPRVTYGDYELEWSGHLLGKGTGQSIDTFLRFNGDPASPYTYHRTGVDATVDRGAPFSHRYTFAITPSNRDVLDVELGFSRTQNDGPPDIRRARLKAELKPRRYRDYYAATLPGNVAFGQT